MTAANGDEERTAVLRRLAWLGANLLLGYCAAFPLTAGAVMWSYAQAEILGNRAAPFGNDNAVITSVFAVLGLALVTAVFVPANRALRRSLRGPRPAVFWTVSCVLLLIPFTVFITCTNRTIPALLGRGILW